MYIIFVKEATMLCTIAVYHCIDFQYTLLFVHTHNNILHRSLVLCQAFVHNQLMLCETLYMLCEALLCNTALRT